MGDRPTTGFVPTIRQREIVRTGHSDAEFVLRCTQQQINYHQYQEKVHCMPQEQVYHLSHEIVAPIRHSDDSYAASDYEWLFAVCNRSRFKHAGSNRRILSSPLLKVRSHVVMET